MCVCVCVQALLYTVLSVCVSACVCVCFHVWFFTVLCVCVCVQVCVQALLYTVLWQPVDPEVEELLSREAVVRRPEVEPGATVRPPWGYGLLQARQEAQKALALRSLMKVQRKRRGEEQTQAQLR